jgi:hypothetical protein
MKMKTMKELDIIYDDLMRKNHDPYLGYIKNVEYLILERGFGDPKGIKERRECRNKILPVIQKWIETQSLKDALLNVGRNWEDQNNTLFSAYKEYDRMMKLNQIKQKINKKR